MPRSRDTVNPLGTIVSSKAPTAIDSERERERDRNEAQHPTVSLSGNKGWSARTKYVDAVIV